GRYRRPREPARVTGERLDWRRAGLLEPPDSGRCLGGHRTTLCLRTYLLPIPRSVPAPGVWMPMEGHRETIDLEPIPRSSRATARRRVPPVLSQARAPEQWPWIRRPGPPARAWPLIRLRDAPLFLSTF